MSYRFFLMTTNHLQLKASHNGCKGTYTITASHVSLPMVTLWPGECARLVYRPGWKCQGVTPGGTSTMTDGTWCINTPDPSSPLAMFGSMFYTVSKSFQEGGPPRCSQQ